MASYGSVLFLSIPLSVAVSVGLWSMAYGVLVGRRRKLLECVCVCGGGLSKWLGFS